MSNAVTVKTISNMPLMFDMTWLSCFGLWSWCSFHLRGLLFGFCIITVKPGFISSSAYWEDVLIVTDFIELYGSHIYANSSILQWAIKAQAAQTSAASLRPPWGFTGTFRLKSLTCHWPPKWYFISLCWWLCCLRMFICAVCGWTAWTHTIFSWHFPTFELRKPLNSLCFSHGIVTKSCSGTSYVYKTVVSSWSKT